MERLVLRVATADDAARLLEWRNDPVVREGTRRRERVKPAEHAAWLESVLADPDRHLLIAEENRKPIGQVRLDRIDDGLFEISTSIDASHRGRGLGTVLLAGGVEWIRELSPGAAVQAYVDPENVPSMRMCFGAGFESTGRRDDEGLELLVNSAEG